MSGNEANLLFEYVSKGKSYIEIGVLFGVSLIIAAWACPGQVHGIDPLDRYYDEEAENETGLTPTRDIVEENIHRAGIDPKRVFLHEHKHPPWPEKLATRRFDVGLIDGDHSFLGCLYDWFAMSHFIDKYVLFHDIEHPKGGVPAVWQIACNSPEWEFVEKSGKMGVLKRVSD